MRKCPACASEVPAEARVCAHCRGKLPRVDARWWKADDGLLYPPHLHPDFANRKVETPPRQPMKRTTKIVLGAGAAAVALAAVAWFTNLGGIRCDYFRDELRQAKADRGLGGGTVEEREAVADAARKARSEGCDVDDLIDPAVGR